jgi:hypothetical protein
MEKFFSLDSMSKNIFTESSSTFREFPNALLSKNHNIYVEAIKQAIAISDNMVKVNLEEAFKDTLYRIKETEKNISKNILFEDYAFNLKFVKPNISEINRPIHVYHYKNLCDSNSPNLCKLNEQLDKFITVLTRFKSIGNYTDKQAFCEFLNENSSKLLEECHNINNDVLGCTDKDPIDNLDFIKNSYSHFRDLDDSPLGEEYSAGIPTRKCVEYIKNEHIDIPVGVKGYNSELTSTIHKINTVLSLLDSVYTDYDFEVKEAKKKFKHAFIVYTSKYLSRANIAYSIKYINICEFLNPNNDSENKSELIEGCDIIEDIIDNDVDDILMESFEDIISNENEVYKEPEYFVPKLMIMETEFTGLLTQEIMNEAEGDQTTNTSNNGGEKPSDNTTDTSNNNNTNTTTNNNDSIFTTIGNKIKELWEAIKNFFSKLFGKATEAANNLSISAQNNNVEELHKKYNGGNGFDQNRFPQLKASDNYSKAIDNIKNYIKNLENKSNAVNTILVFNDPNKDNEYTEAYFANSLLPSGANYQENNNISLAEWAKSYFYGNSNPTPDNKDATYSFGPGVAIEAFQNLNDFTISAGTNTNSIQNSTLKIIENAEKITNVAENKIKTTNEMAEITQFHIEKVLEEYFGKDYKALQEDGNGTVDDIHNANNANASDKRMVAAQKSDPNTAAKGAKALAARMKANGYGNKQAQPAPQVQDNKVNRIKNIQAACYKFTQVLKAITAAANTVIGVIGNDWKKITDVINGVDQQNNNNQQQSDNGEENQNNNNQQQSDNGEEQQNK